MWYSCRARLLSAMVELPLALLSFALLMGILCRVHHSGRFLSPRMIRIRRSVIVQHSAERMFDLVNDVASYPTRFTWCTAADVLDHDASHITARLEVRVAGFAQSFTTRNTLEPPTHI